MKRVKMASVRAFLHRDERELPVYSLVTVMYGRQMSRRHRCHVDTDVASSRRRLYCLLYRSLTRPLNVLPALKVGVALSGMNRDSPVAGLRPFRAERMLRSKLPNPGMLILSPWATAAWMESKMASTATLASVLVSEQFVETMLTRSCLPRSAFAERSRCAWAGGLNTWSRETFLRRNSDVMATGCGVVVARVFDGGHGYGMYREGEKGS